MRFEKVDPRSVAKFVSWYKRTKVAAIVEEFIEANIPMAKVVYDNGEYANMASAQSSLYRAIKAMHADNILCKSTGGNLYLINKLLIEDSVKL